MKIEKKQPNKHQVELTIRVDEAAAKPMLEQAANRLSQARPIKGFRPGKAPYDLVKRDLGEARILEEAMDDIINDTFNDVLKQENINYYGKIGFDLLPVVPGEVAAYKATLTLMPTATLGDWKSKKIKRGEVKVSDDDINGALDELANMVTTEEPSANPAVTGDKAVVDFEVKVEGKVIEGGTAKDFALILGEGRMIPGFEEKIVGAKPGETVEFSLSFPKDYQAAHLSGKPAEFKVKVNQVLNRIKPVVDDAMALRLGMPSLAELKAKLTENIKKEKTDKAEEKLEIAAIKQITDTTKYDAFPPAMVADTVEDLVTDFEHSLAHQGMKMDSYLVAAKKSMDQIRNEFEPKAVDRIKSSLALGKLAEEEQIKVDIKELEEELQAMKRAHAGHDHAPEDTSRPEVRRHAANSVINRKIVQLIRDTIIE